MHQRPPTAALLLLALLLPLIAACSTAPASGSIPANPAPGQTAGEPARSDSSGAAARSAPAQATPIPTTTSGKAAEAGADMGVAAAAPPERSGETLAEPVQARPDVAGVPAPPPPQSNSRQQQYTPIKAGEVDDNADFASYLSYLNSFYSPPAHTVDVSERYIIKVVNDQQQPVLDARVQVFDGQRQVFDGLTYAGGQTIFFPRASSARNRQELRLRIEKGNSSIEQLLIRGQDQTQTYTLSQAAALPQQPRLDVLFLLDATGSMDDEIGQIQQTIVSIADQIDQFSPRPDLRFGLVAYRDRGDAYVTRVYDFTPDVVAFRELLLSVSADGGGDEPESLNAALHAAIQQVNWAQDAVRLTFLVADAPPHLDYANDYDYVQEVRAAVAKGVKIYPIAASNTNDQAEYVFRQLAQQTLATFIFLTYQPGQESGPPGEATTHHVDPAAFTVERLDDLVVQVVQRELARAVGAS